MFEVIVKCTDRKIGEKFIKKLTEITEEYDLCCLPVRCHNSYECTKCIRAFVKIEVVEE